MFDLETNLAQMKWIAFQHSCVGFVWEVAHESIESFLNHLLEKEPACDDQTSKPSNYSLKHKTSGTRIEIGDYKTHLLTFLELHRRNCRFRLATATSARYGHTLLNTRKGS
jgi:hypothetical protein